LIGKGRYGSVYKCGLVLKDKMMTVAVKVFDLQQSGSSKTFLAECEALSKIRHRNLISFITCCSSSDSNQNDFKAIVFEFMTNGSLDRWLNLDVRESQQLQGLTLAQRLNIAVDIADALDYLHNNCEPPIVHCDLKPSNVLLDEDMVAHVSDFGISKFLREGDNVLQTNTLATIGYIAPEYGHEGLVSTSCDVYSYGILLMEVFCRKKPVDEMFTSDLSLKNWVSEALHNDVTQVIDSSLVRKEEEQFTAKVSCVVPSLNWH